MTIIARSPNRITANNVAGTFPDPIADSVVWDKPPLPRQVGLALGGGAARGVAHIGVLQVLEEHEIPLHCIVGTSAGAVVGGLYAAGIDPAQLQAHALELSWSQISSLSLPSVHLGSLRLGSINLAAMSMPLGILDLDRLVEYLEEMLGDRQTFDRLPIPFAAIATDISGGQMVVMNDGQLAPAIRASCAIPGIFTPVHRNGRLLIDGGAVNNLPVSVARQMGAGYVIAVDLLPWDRDTPKEPTNIIELSLMSLYALVRSTQSDSPRANITIQPDIAHIRLMDLGAAPELIEAGRAAAEAALPQILNALGRAAESGTSVAASAADSPATGSAAETPTAPTTPEQDSTQTGSEAEPPASDG